MHGLKQRLEELAVQYGFHRLGVARAEPLGLEAERLRRWLAEGRHGDMRYMEDTVEVRANPVHEGMLPSARSVIVLATSYARADGAWGPAPGKVARYAHGRDYHNVLQKRGRKIAQVLRNEGHTARVGVDSMPLYERAWAQRAGVGFIGKNCCLIVPGLGSHVFLTVIVTSAELAPDAPIKERCGSCTRCLDACPTKAFVATRELDARRCISYLTIEQRGAISSELMEQMGDWMFGCDACQDICPFNATSPLPADQTTPFAQDARRTGVTAADLLRMNEAEFAVFAEGSPMKRPGRVGLARNAAVVLGNSGDKRYLPVLQEAGQGHESELVRATARWAAAKLERDEI